MTGIDRGNICSSMKQIDNTFREFQKGQRLDYRKRTRYYPERAINYLRNLAKEVGTGMSLRCQQMQLLSDATDRVRIETLAVCARR